MMHDDRGVVYFVCPLRKGVAEEDPSDEAAASGGGDDGGVGSGGGGKAANSAGGGGGDLESGFKGRLPSQGSASSMITRSHDGNG